jgi:hypothetical protein
MVRKHLVDSYSSLSRLAHVKLTHLDGALSERGAFFAVYIVWKHLALTGPITLGRRDDIPAEKDVVFESKQKLIDEMLRRSDEEKVRT